MLIKYAKYTALHVLSSTGHGFKSCHCSKNRSLVRLSVVCGILSKVRGFAVKSSCIIKGCMHRPSEKWDNSVLIIYQLLPIVTVIFDYQFVCVSLVFFFWGFRPTRKLLTHVEKKIQIWTLYSLPLSSEGSLKCHTCDDTGQPFILVISEDPWHSHIIPRLWQWSCPYLF